MLAAHCQRVLDSIGPAAALLFQDDDLLLPARFHPPIKKDVVESSELSEALVGK